MQKQEHFGPKLHGHAPAGLAKLSAQQLTLSPLHPDLETGRQWAQQPLLLASLPLAAPKLGFCARRRQLLTISASEGRGQKPSVPFQKVEASGKGKRHQAGAMLVAQVAPRVAGQQNVEPLLQGSRAHGAGGHSRLRGAAGSREQAPSRIKVS